MEARTMILPASTSAALGSEFIAAYSIAVFSRLQTRLDHRDDMETGED